MAHEEIEYKLALPVRAAPLLRRLPCLAGVPNRRRWLDNIYLDTPDARLLRAGMALRRRRSGTEWRLTLKSEGIREGGISRREEWEYPLPPDILDFSAIDDAPLRGRLEALAPDLRPVFHVGFMRQTWLLTEETEEDSRIELALDLGRIRAGRRRASLHEIELELLAGKERALTALAGRLQAALPILRPAIDSKAARGYALAGMIV
jgi:inorganic triphosphatase YgiF